MCLHTIVLDPSYPERIFIAISAAGVFRSDDTGKTWRPMNRGLKSPYELGGVGRGPDARMIRVVLPAHLRTLARVDGEVKLEIAGPPTLRAVLDALEAGYPMLRGTIRDQVTQRRRAFLRFFACGEDLSHEPPDTPLPDAVATGAEPFMVVGAMAGG